MAQQRYESNKEDRTHAYVVMLDDAVLCFEDAIELGNRKTANSASAGFLAQGLETIAAFAKSYRSNTGEGRNAYRDGGAPIFVLADARVVGSLRELLKAVEHAREMLDEPGRLLEETLSSALADRDPYQICKLAPLCGAMARAAKLRATRAAA